MYNIVTYLSFIVNFVSVCFMQGMTTRIHRALLGGASLLLVGVCHAFPQPGSYISNVASGDYTDEMGNVLLVNSNPVALEVQKTYSLTLLQNQNQYGAIGGTVNLPHVLTNTGNTTDRYTLSLVQSSNDNFDLSNVKVYADRDQNGLPDNTEDLLLGSIELNAGQSLAVVIVGSIPTTVAFNQLSSLDLKAVSQQNATLSAQVTDTIRVVDDAVISLIKAQSASEGIIGDQITYTLTYRNTGTATRRVVLQDVLDDSLEYVSGSAIWNQNTTALTDANDTEASANTGITYQLKPDGKSLEASIAAVAPLSSGTLSFKAKVKQGAANKIPNTAGFVQYDTDNMTVKLSSFSNTVIYNLAAVYGVVLNNKSSSATNVGNPNSSPDNLVIQASLTPGQEVFFNNYVWNVGNTTDVYNLSYSSSNLPSCAKVNFYTQDGKTLLTDTNGDGKVDTGSISSAAVKQIQVGVSASTGCNSSVSHINVDVVATSIASNLVSDPIRNQITALTVVSSSSDLYNADQSGLGVGVVDNLGQALRTVKVASAKAVFPLVAKNNSTQANNYNLYASFSAIDVANIVPTTKTGFSVKFYEGDASCQTVGKQITNTGTLAAGASKAYCAVIDVDASQQNFSIPIWFAIQSPVNQQADSIKNQIESNVARLLTLTNDQQGQVGVGGTIVYAHTLKNLGNMAEGANAGSQVNLKVVPLKNDGFVYSLYYDANKNGQIDSTDQIISATTSLNQLLGSAGLLPQTDIQLLLKVQAAPSAPEGVVSQADIWIEISDFNGIHLDNLKNTDVTTVATGHLQLLKTQAANSSCITSNLAALSYTTQLVSVKPNQCVAYKLTLKNDGSSVVKNVQFNDVVPAYTSLVGTPVIVPTGVDLSSGEKVSALVSSLDPNQEANFYFVIRVNP
ncbi:isopeptide-forming domain-containing fimbrial protein [Acinetobacter tandoii]|uniref:Isopeptide-forming domain-containing fimbrial protein n=1 Tax=Acinetobacter tandoii TaxID=202954 RepID=A0A5N4WFV5_9GAMM|nr:isopeptide-forming domain-containing fimbrial protein [Acinetobacter tandoii]KAB1854529.1 isopeptide-forming domain-containing fimbrial protein [Acinetobacter tandoii]